VIQVGTLEAAIAYLVQASATSVATIDLSMPGMNGVTSLAGIRIVCPHVRLVVVTASERREDILQALDAGAHGFIPRTYRTTDMLAAFRTILEGRIFVPPNLAEKGARASCNTLRARPSHPGGSPILSPRQRSVMDLLALGRSNKEIARELEMAEGTVKIHVNAIYRTLGARNRVSAVAAVAALGDRLWRAAELRA
jgi:DNA-binding NarL/FixJ family response regulator